MPDKWMDRPRVYPYKCRVSGQGDLEHGPYYEFDIEYEEYPDGPLCRMYVSHKYLLQPFDKADAPYKVVTEEFFNDLKADLAREKEEVKRLEIELDDCERARDHEAELFTKARARKTRKADG